MLSGWYTPTVYHCCFLLWPISVTYAIICTGHPIFKTCQKLSQTSCYYQQKSCYYHTPHAIINKNHAIIKLLMLLSIKLMLLSYNLRYYQTPQQLMLSNTSCLLPWYQIPHVIIRHIILLSKNSCYYQHLNLLSLHFISYYYSSVQPSLIVAQMVEPGFKSRSGKKSFGGFKDGDLEDDNRFMAAHITLREKLSFGQKSYLNQKLYFLK